MANTPKMLIVDDKIENLVALERILADVDADLVRATSGNVPLSRATRSGTTIVAAALAVVNRSWTPPWPLAFLTCTSTVRPGRVASKAANCCLKISSSLPSGEATASLIHTVSV